MLQRNKNAYGMARTRFGVVSLPVSVCLVLPIPEALTMTETTVPKEEARKYFFELQFLNQRKRFDTQGSDQNE